jgi:putative transposase
MFADEAGFGRISTPAACWCPKGTRPIVPCHHIREYRYAYGAVEPQSGNSFFLVLPRCDTDCMNVFLRELSAQYLLDYILLATDNAGWHKSKSLEIPDNIKILFIPPRTPEMNPIEQIWKEIRKRGFKNKLFSTLNHVIDHLCDTINSLSAETVKSITGRDWILSMFYFGISIIAFNLKKCPCKFLICRGISLGYVIF